MHGLRRSNADKRRAMQMLLDDAEWVQWSDREVAKACAVSHTFVAEQRRAIWQPLPDSPVASTESAVAAPATRTVTRNGTTYKQKVKVKPASEPPPVSNESVAAGCEQFDEVAPRRHGQASWNSCSKSWPTSRSTWPRTWRERGNGPVSEPDA